jgi:hypothetical protein
VVPLPIRPNATCEDGLIRTEGEMLAALDVTPVMSVALPALSVSRELMPVCANAIHAMNESASVMSGMLQRVMLPALDPTHMTFNQHACVTVA